jgi:hypothetical protein
MNTFANQQNIGKQAVLYIWSIDNALYKKEFLDSVVGTEV